VFGRRQAVERRVVDLRDILKRLRPLLERLVGDEAVAVEFRSCVRAAHVRVDPTQVEQIAVNLAINARDAMPRGGTLTIDIDVVALDEATAAKLDCEAGPYARLTVSDTGVGMPTEVRSRVFEPFFTTKAAGKGTGLGLSIVYAAVKQNEGALALESEVSRGTMFRIHFPLVAAADEVVDVSERRLLPVPKAPDRAACRHALVIDDDPMNLTVVAHLLESLGCEVSTSTDPDTIAATLGQAATQGRPIDLVLLDVHLHGSSGLDACRRLRDDGIDVAILCMSGGWVATPEYVEAGFDGIVTKPIDHAMLRSCIERYAGWSHARSAPRLEGKPPVAAGA